MDYKTANRRGNVLLSRHLQRMNELIASGLDRETASKQAYKEITENAKGIAAGKSKK